jgi:hypothetical protein
LKSGNDPRTEFIKKVAEKIASDYLPTDVPALSADAVKQRVAAIARSNGDNPLPLVAELRYCQFKKLAEPAELDPAYDHVFGPGGARKMLQGDDAERREAVAALFSADKSSPKL